MVKKKPYKQKQKDTLPTLEKWPCVGTLKENEPWVIKIPFVQEGLGTIGHCFLFIDEAREVLKHTTLIKQFINRVDQEKLVGK